jgi:N-acetylglucosaminyldiphosphoundecaprenol N-acetyl-beta-D-mannosaminyltransferase
MNAFTVLKDKQKIDLKGKLTTFINPYSYLYFRNNVQLFNEFDHLFLDGVLLVGLFRILGVKTSRYSFDMTSLAPKVFSDAVRQNQTIFIIGSNQESIQDFVKVITSKYKGLPLVGFNQGFFKTPKERDRLLDHIANLSPDIVIVGMGTPLQEFFLIDLKNKGWSGFGYTCGGFIHQTIKKPNYYPTFFNTLNLRAIYRMIDEPKLISRYLFLYPKSIGLFIMDFIKSKQRFK